VSNPKWRDDDENFSNDAATINQQLWISKIKTTSWKSEKQTTLTMGISAMCIAALCLIASLSMGANAFVVQPRSVSAFSAKPAVPSLMHVARKRPQQQHPAGRRVIIQTAAAIVVVDSDSYEPESSEPSTTDVSAVPDWKRTAKLTILFSLWYVLNVGYNIGNKRVLNALPIPWTAATVELFFGFPYVALLWTTGLRKKPKLSVDNVKTLSSQAFFLGVTHVLEVISFGATTISFTHIFSKKVLDGKPLGENLTPANMFAVLTILGFLFILPVSLMVEGPGKVSSAWVAALARGYTNAQLFRLLSVSGFLYYIYNEVAFLALSEVAPVTPAVASTAKLVAIILFCSCLSQPRQRARGDQIKRTVIILASTLVFRNPVSKLGAIGLAFAIGGAMVYYNVKSKRKAKEETKRACVLAERRPDDCMVRISVPIV
jgi:solute carrier family 35 protein E1